MSPADDEPEQGAPPRLLPEIMLCIAAALKRGRAHASLLAVACASRETHALVVPVLLRSLCPRTSWFPSFARLLTSEGETRSLVRSLRLEDNRVGPAGVATCLAAFRRLEHLHLYLDLRGLDAVAVSLIETLDCLRALRVECQDVASSASLGNLRFPANVEKLELEAINRIDNAGSLVERIEGCPKLSTLVLKVNFDLGRMQDAIAGSSSLVAKLTRLQVRLQSVFHALFRHPHLKLEHLSVVCTTDDSLYTPEGTWQVLAALAGLDTFRIFNACTTDLLGGLPQCRTLVLLDCEPDLGADQVGCMEAAIRSRAGRVLLPKGFSDDRSRPGSHTAEELEMWARLAADDASSVRSSGLSGYSTESDMEGFGAGEAESDFEGDFDGSEEV
ncbi:hypothetical protein DFJ74DRAFT_775210 [Hyaloraphidium curvatum]|nr:hypothetical protein DFJ74DRAFT_775210 [Hyaloraphidium curvatum]